MKLPQRARISGLSGFRQQDGDRARVGTHHPQASLKTIARSLNYEPEPRALNRKLQSLALNLKPCVLNPNPTLYLSQVCYPRHSSGAFGASGLPPLPLPGRWGCLGPRQGLGPQPPALSPFPSGPEDHDILVAIPRNGVGANYTTRRPHEARMFHTPCFRLGLGQKRLRA